ncbi:septum formation initiator [Kutzneria kofuensis]|uniref:Outer membrane murein-binding lipoprotein Lpp n=1 Tax=Kutzneria kofuensis TaxID=103725 RepID=A0A7W9NJ66_9PSEU|nr:septum formation initiator [Kutzneria kofuensis]MBB5894294.1 outer membrane murein-binding lipoprotein Lpp [Kutzneria kofuensis]
MSAPARVGAPTPRTRTTRRSGERKIERDPAQTGTRATRGRTTAAQRAYARKANRKQRWLRLSPSGLPKLAPRTPFVLLVMALLAAGVLATLFLSISAVSDSYRLEDAKQKTTDLTSRVEQLKADVAKGESPEVLYDEARKLGMVPAPDPARIKVNPDGSVSVTGSAVPATTTTTPPPSSSAPPPSSGQPANSGTTSTTGQPPASGGGH